MIHNFRNFDYFSKTDFRPRWETKIVQLSREIDTSLPFAELRRLSYIDYRARDADDDPTFSSLIRKGIPEIP